MSLLTPSQVLQRTINAIYVMVVTLGVFALIAIGPLGIALLVGRTRIGPGHIVYFGVMALSFGAPATLYMVVLTQLRKRKPWAAVMGLTVATVHAISAVLVIAFAAWELNFIGPVLLIPAGTALIMLFLSIILIYRIWRLSKSLHELDAHQTVGFTPIMPS